MIAARKRVTTASESGPAHSVFDGSSGGGVHENPLLTVTPGSSEKIRVSSAPAGVRESVTLDAEASAQRLRALASFSSMRATGLDDGGSSDGGGEPAASAAERVQLARTLSVYNPTSGSLAMIDGAGRRGFVALQADATPSSAPAEAPLPPGWRERYSATKRAKYWHNAESGESTWTRPKTAEEAAAWAAEAVLPPLPDGWTASWSARAQALFYSDADAGTTVWERPSPEAAEAVPVPLEDLPLAPTAAAAPDDDQATAVDQTAAAAAAEEAARPALPRGWSAHWSARALTTFYADEHTGQTSWVRPPAEQGQAPLPPGWIAIWSRTREEYYYRNDDTGEIAWDRPA